MIGIALVLAAVGVTALGLDPWWTWPLVYPAVLWAPGLGWARWLNGDRRMSRLQVGLDAAWIGAALAWIDVALIRELGVAATHHPASLLGLAMLWTLIGTAMSRSVAPALPASPSERLGGVAVVLAVLLVAAWRWGDVIRPLDGTWYMEGADTEGYAPLSIEPADGQAEATAHGWEEAGAFSIEPTDGRVVLAATDDAHGRLVLAVRGPVGSTVAAEGERNTVAASMIEDPDEGSVRRYLTHGVAGIAVDVSLTAGETVEIQVDGDRLYVLPGTEAVWSLHADGALRYVHYYQLLNQVENQVWAEELLTTRRLTLHQPPGWSPLLSTATVFLVPDMQAGTTLFLFVLVLVGLSAVRLGAVLVPAAPRVAFLVPAGMVASHGLLMFEPASTNFPDSLFAVAVLAVATAIASGRLGWIAGLGIAAGLLRWPGVVLSTLFILGWWATTRTHPMPAIKRLWGLVGVGAVIAALATVSGDVVDLGFILYFETFPEHWHGNYDIADLWSRVPGFFGLWTQYTGGGLVLALAMWFSRPSEARSRLRYILGSIGAYSLLLCTIDHHPTHYFLPLVACTGVAVIAASACLSVRALRTALPIACLIGLWIFLWGGQV